MSEDERVEQIRRTWRSEAMVPVSSDETPDRLDLARQDIAHLLERLERAEKDVVLFKKLYAERFTRQTSEELLADLSAARTRLEEVREELKRWRGLSSGRTFDEWVVGIKKAEAQIARGESVPLADVLADAEQSRWVEESREPVVEKPDLNSPPIDTKSTITESSR